MENTTCPFASRCSRVKMFRGERTVLKGSIRIAVELNTDSVERVVFKSIVVTKKNKYDP